MKAIHRVLEILSNAMLALGAAGVVLMMLNVVLDVTLKYLLNQPVPGTLEMVSYYFMAACAFLPFAHVQKKRAHIEMDLATDWLPPKALRYLVAVVYLVSAVYLGLFAWASGVEAFGMTEVGESTSAIYFEILIWPGRWFVTFGVGVTACWMLLQSVQGFLGRGDD